MANTKYDPSQHDPTVVVVPRECTWDKLTALVIFVWFVLGKRLKDVVVRFQDEFRNADGDPSTDALPPEYFDIDVRKKYNEADAWEYRCGREEQCGHRIPATENAPQRRSCPKCGVNMYLRGYSQYGSATHCILEQAGLANRAGAAHLIAILNRNNGRGAYLKNDFPESLVKLIREIYELPHNVSFIEYRLRVLRFFEPVVLNYFAAADRNAAAVDQIENPFCLEGYEQICRLNGMTDDDGRRLFALFRDKFAKVKERHEFARQRARDAKPRIFTVPGYHRDKPAEVHLVESDDRLVGRFYFGSHREQHPRLGIVVIRGSDGNYAVLARGPWNLSKLHAVLSSMEPGRWHFERRYRNPMLLNGSASRSSVPSQIRPGLFIELIGQNCRAPVHLGHRKHGRADARIRQTV